MLLDLYPDAREDTAYETGRLLSEMSDHVHHVPRARDTTDVNFLHRGVMTDDSLPTPASDGRCSKTATVLLRTKTALFSRGDKLIS